MEPLGPHGRGATRAGVWRARMGSAWAAAPAPKTKQGPNRTGPRLCDLIESFERRSSRTSPTGCCRIRHGVPLNELVPDPPGHGQAYMGSLRTERRAWAERGMVRGLVQASAGGRRILRCGGGWNISIFTGGGRRVWAGAACATAAESRGVCVCEVQAVAGFHRPLHKLHRLHGREKNFCGGESVHARR